MKKNIVIFGILMLAGLVVAEVRNIKGVNMTPGAIPAMSATEAGRVVPSTVTAAELVAMKASVANMTTGKVDVVTFETTLGDYATTEDLGSYSTTAEADELYVAKSDSTIVVTNLTAAVLAFDPTNTTTDEMAEVLATLSIIIQGEELPSAE